MTNDSINQQHLFHQALKALLIPHVSKEAKVYFFAVFYDVFLSPPY